MQLYNSESAIAFVLDDAHQRGVGAAVELTIECVAKSGPYGPEHEQMERFIALRGATSADFEQRLRAAFAAHDKYLFAGAS